MCAYAIRLARITCVVSGARSADAGSAINGYLVLIDAKILPGRTPPSVMRDVLARECRAVMDERKHTPSQR
jgi:tRNA(Arg) A34 adenosine deaminase TadA